MLDLLEKPPAERALQYEEIGPIAKRGLILTAQATVLTAHVLLPPKKTVPVIFPRSRSLWRMMDMRTSKYSQDQIIGFLRQVEAGMPVKEIGRKHGFSDASFYKWRSRYRGMDASEAKRLRELKPRASGI